MVIIPPSSVMFTKLKYRNLLRKSLCAYFVYSLDGYKSNIF